MGMVVGIIMGMDMDMGVMMDGMLSQHSEMLGMIRLLIIVTRTVMCTVSYVRGLILKEEEEEEA